MLLALSLLEAVGCYIRKPLLQEALIRRHSSSAFCWQAMVEGAVGEEE
jgi:hypothetical protein